MTATTPTPREYVASCQQSAAGCERDQLRVPRGGWRYAAAGAAAALPRKPRQLGSGADRRAGIRSAGRDVRQRRSGRVDRNHAEHGRADGDSTRSRSSTRWISARSTSSGSRSGASSPRRSRSSGRRVRRLVLASSAPQGAAGMHGWAPGVIGPSAALPPTRTDTSACSSRARRQAGRRGWRLSTE